MVLQEWWSPIEYCFTKGGSSIIKKWSFKRGGLSSEIVLQEGWSPIKNGNLRLVENGLTIWATNIGFTR